MKKHSVRIYNNRKGTYTSVWYESAEQAYTGYVKAIEVIRNTIADGESFSVMRFNEGYLMTVEDIVK